MILNPLPDPFCTLGLDYIAASEPHDLLLIPGLLPASITAASLGDHQAAAYLRFTAQHFAAFHLPSTSEYGVFCTAAAQSSSLGEPGDELYGSAQRCETIYRRRKHHTMRLFHQAAKKGMLAALKWLRALCQPDTDADWPLMRMAAEEGHLQVMQHLRTGPNPASWTTASEYAVEHPECLKWLLDSGSPCHRRVLPLSACRGDLETLRWIHAHPKAHCPQPNWNADVTAAAAEGGSQAVLQWLQAPPCSCPWDSSCTMWAAGKGNVPMLQWLWEQECPADSTVTMDAGMCGSLPMLQWLRARNVPWDATLCMSAARRGDVAMLQWARSQNPCCPWDERSCRSAACAPFIDCLQWLRGQDPPCPWDSGCYHVAAALDVLKWLRSQDPPCPLDGTVSEEAARCGDLPKLQWLQDQGCEIDGGAYHAAASFYGTKPHEHVLKWLHDVGIPAPSEPPSDYFDGVRTLLFMADKGFPLLPEHRKIVSAARKSLCTVIGLLRWFRRGVSDPTCGAHRAFDYFAPSNAGQDLLVRLSQLPSELITRIAVAADLQQVIMQHGDGQHPHDS